MKNTVKTRAGEQGYLLVGLLVLVFIIMLTLGVAAPTVARSLQRDKEVESMHRAQQYQRAIQIYYRKLGHYPASVDQLMDTNNQRFLRKKYKDPLTGKDDWRIIHLGEAKTQIKGFFGQPMGPASGGLGSAAGMASNIGGTQTTGQMPGAPGGLGATPSPGGGAAGAPGAPGTPGTSGPGSSGFGSSGFGSQSSNPLNGGGGFIMGVGTSKSGASILAVNGDQVNYQDWEFIYDPRMDQLKAQASLFGGAPASQPASGLGGSNGFGGSNSPGGATTPGGTPPPTDGSATPGSSTTPR